MCPTNASSRYTSDLFLFVLISEYEAARVVAGAVTWIINTLEARLEPSARAHMSVRRTVETTSLVTKRAEVVIEGGDSDGDGVEIDLDFTPAKRAGTSSPERSKASPPSSAVKLQRTEGGGVVSPRGGRPWLKPTHSAVSKSRGKASDAAPRKERHFAMIEADEERLERALSTNAGVAAGERMYYMAMKMKQRSVSQQAAAATAASSSPREKECTFRPELSCGTVRLIEDSGAYRPPSERFDAQELRLAKARLIQQHANMRVETAECTFKPSVDAVSVALVRRSRSASRSRTEDSPAGPRLFDEGKRRHQHQQLLHAQIKMMEDEERVGGRLRLGKADADAVSRRLQRWQQQKDHDIELLRHEEVLSWRPTRSRSCDDLAFFTRLHAPPANTETSPPPSRGGNSKHKGVASPTARASSRSRQLADELQKIRFRALFAKYVPSASPDGTLTVELVRDQIKKLFPHDSGIADALSHFKIGEPITRRAFVGALCAYERKYGPQRWGRMEHHRLQEEESDDDIAGGARPRKPGQPQISTHSHELTARRGTAGKPIFEQLLERGKEADKRRLQRQKEYLDEKMKDATFRPTLNDRASHAAARGRSLPNKSTLDGEQQRSTSATPRTPKASKITGGGAGASLNVSIEHPSVTGARTAGTPQRPLHHNWGDTGSNCDEVDDLLRSINEELQISHRPANASSAPGSRCSAPITPHLRGEEAFNRLDLSAHRIRSEHQRAVSPSSQLLLNKSLDVMNTSRTPLRRVDWNQSSQNRSTFLRVATPPSTKKSSQKSFSPSSSPPASTRRVASFAASADSMLDMIYCDVSIEKRYTQVQQQWSPNHRRSGASSGARAVSHKERRTVVVEGHSRKAFR